MPVSAYIDQVPDRAFVQSNATPSAPPIRFRKSIARPDEKSSYTTACAGEKGSSGLKLARRGPRTLTTLRPVAVARRNDGGTVSGFRYWFDELNCDICLVQALRLESLAVGFRATIRRLRRPNPVDPVL
jgi:hypothetical protein